MQSSPFPLLFGLRASGVPRPPREPEHQSNLRIIGNDDVEPNGLDASGPLPRLGSIAGRPTAP